MTEEREAALPPSSHATSATAAVRVRFVRIIVVVLGLGIILGAFLFSNSSESYATQKGAVDHQRK